MRLQKVNDGLIIWNAPHKTTLEELLRLIPPEYRKNLTGGEKVIRINIHIVDGIIRYVFVEK